MAGRPHKPSVVLRVRWAAAVIAALGVLAGAFSFATLRHAEAQAAAAWTRTTSASTTTLDTMRTVRAWETEAVLLFERRRTTQVGGEPSGTAAVMNDLGDRTAEADEAFLRLRTVVDAEFVETVESARVRWQEAVRLAEDAGTDTAVIRQVLKDLDDVGVLLEQVVDAVVASNEADLAEVEALRRQAGLAMTAVLLLVSAVLAAWALQLSASLSGGFAAIALATRRFADNDLGHRVPPFAEADLDALGASFNGMAERLSAGQRQLEQQATTDPLTELPNRRALFKLLSDMWPRDRTGVAVATFVMIDLDGFKEINDAFGHLVGDQVLCAVGRRLQDVLAPGDVVARLGGDEFALLITGNQAATEVELVVQAVLDEVRRPLELSDRVLTVAASAGVARMGDASDPLELLRNADVAMYEAKNRGRGVLCWFHPLMQRAVAERVALQAALVAALHDDQFVLHYQPILRADTGRVTAVEALVRWQHPTLGLIGPDRFIPLAEASGAILQLGSLVLTKALAMVHVLDCDPTAGTEPVRVNVNLSPRQLQNPSLVDEVRDQLFRAGVAADRLVLEITESALIEDVDAAIAQLVALRALGVRLALDDFGAGYCSLSYLQRLPVDSVKVDRSLTAPVPTDRGAAAIVEAVVSIGAATGFQVVAEGIETQEQGMALTRLGCDHLQGYLYSKPVPPGDLALVLAGLRQAASTQASAIDPRYCARSG